MGERWRGSSRETEHHVLQSEPIHSWIHLFRMSAAFSGERGRRQHVNRNRFYLILARMF